MSTLNVLVSATIVLIPPYLCFSVTTWNSNLLKLLGNAMKINSSAVNLSFQIQHRSTKSFIVSKSFNCFITKFFNFFHHWNTKRFLPCINFVFWTLVKVLICIHFKGCLFSEGTYFLFLFHPQKYLCVHSKLSNSTAIFSTQIFVYLLR